MIIICVGILRQASIILTIADILRGVRDDMRNRELGRSDSLHQVFVLS